MAIWWKRFPHYWPSVRGTRPSPVNSPHKGELLCFSILQTWTRMLMKQTKLAVIWDVKTLMWRHYDDGRAMGCLLWVWCSKFICFMRLKCISSHLDLRVVSIPHAIPINVAIDDVNVFLCIKITFLVQRKIQIGKKNVIAVVCTNCTCPLAKSSIHVNRVHILLHVSALLTCSLGPSWLTWINFKHGWMIASIISCWMKLLIHS